MPNGKKKIKKIAEIVGKASMVTPFGQAAKVSSEIGKRAGCLKKGGKWVNGKCMSAEDQYTHKMSIKQMDSLRERTGRKKHPGVGNLYPEKE